MSHGHEHYIGLETIFTYEHNSRYSFTLPTREAFMNEIDDEEFSHSPLKNRILIQDAEKFLEENSEAPMEEVSAKFFAAYKGKRMQQGRNSQGAFQRAG